jgi:hypothetical protein
MTDENGPVYNAYGDVVGDDPDTYTDTSPMNSPDPYDAPPDGAGAEMDEDAPDVGSAGIPGQSLVPFLPTGIQQTALALTGGKSPSGVQPLPYSGQSGGMTPARGVSGGGFSNSLLGQVLKTMSQALGFRVTRKKLFRLIAELGLNFVLRAANITPAAMLELYGKRKKRGSRGPHLRTIEKRVRQAAGYKHRLQRALSHVNALRGGGGHRKGGYHAFNTRRRRK